MKKSLDNNDISYQLVIILVINQQINAIMQLVDNKQPINADITRNKNTFSKVFTKNWPREMFITDSVLKTNP